MNSDSDSEWSNMDELAVWSDESREMEEEDDLEDESIDIQEDVEVVEREEGKEADQEVQTEAHNEVERKSADAVLVEQEKAGENITSNVKIEKKEMWNIDFGFSLLLFGLSLYAICGVVHLMANSSCCFHPERAQESSRTINEQGSPITFDLENCINKESTEMKVDPAGVHWRSKNEIITTTESVEIGKVEKQVMHEVLETEEPKEPIDEFDERIGIWHLLAFLVVLFVGVKIIQPTASKPKEDLRDKDVIEQENLELAECNKNLEEALKTIVTDLVDQNHENRAKDEEIKKLQLQLQKLNEKLTVNEAISKELREEIIVSEEYHEMKYADSLAVIADMKYRREDYVQMRKDLEETKTEVKMKNLEIQKLKQDNELSLRQERISLRKKFDEVVQKLVEENKEIEEENKKIDEENRQINEENEEMDQTKLDRMSKLELVDKQLAEMRVAYGESQREIESLNERIVHLNEKLLDYKEMFKHEVRVAQAQRKEAQAANEELKKELEARICEHLSKRQKQTDE